MKNLIGFNFGKERIELWQIFVYIFIVFMFVVCALLGYGVLSTSNNDVKTTSSINTDELSIITDFDNIPDSLYEEEENGITLKEKYNDNYAKYISDSEGVLVIDNPEYNYYGNIDTLVYDIDINKNNWFLFNELTNKLVDTNKIYVVDTEMNFHKLILESATYIKEYSSEEGYIKMDAGAFTFYLNLNQDYFYGYLPVDSDNINDYYLTVSGEGYGLSEGAYLDFFKAIDNNISVTASSSNSYVGVNLSSDYKKVKIDNNISLDLSSNVLINSISNGTKGNRNKINLSYKEGFIGNVTISESNKNIDDYIDDSKKNGYLNYVYGDKSIYLKYNSKEYPEFNFSMGAFNGILLEANGKTILIQFEKEYSFDSQEKLDEQLDMVLSPFVID